MVQHDGQVTNGQGTTQYALAWARGGTSVRSWQGLGEGGAAKAETAPLARTASTVPLMITPSDGAPLVLEPLLDEQCAVTWVVCEGAQ